MTIAKQKVNPPLGQEPDKMQVLISCKTTNLDVHGESIRKKVAAGLLPGDHLARLQEDHAHHHRSRLLLLAALKKRQISVIEVGRGQYWPDLKDVRAVITVGGDGTVLEASHHISGESSVPLIGVRSSPMSVGYLCYCGAAEIEAMVGQLAAGHLPTRPIGRLQAKIFYTETGGERLTDPILNDFLYTNLNPAATTRYRIRLGKQQEVHKSSGVWLATAAGSSAAISAAGGQEVEMGRSDFQYLARELYQPGRQETGRLEKGFFDPDREALTIENLCEQAILALDGQHGIARLGFGDLMTFVRAEPVHMAVRPDRS